MNIECSFQPNIYITISKLEKRNLLKKRIVEIEIGKESLRPSHRERVKSNNCTPLINTINREIISTRLELNLHESLEKPQKLYIRNTPSSTRVFRPVSNVIVAGHATAGPLLTRIYDAAWPRARLMRQTYVAACRGCGRASASGADRVCVYVGRDSPPIPYSAPLPIFLCDRSKCFDPFYQLIFQ